MASRCALVCLMALLAATSEVLGVPKCPALCPLCPEIPPCPPPKCPVPTCPALPDVPPCPPPRCPPPPPIPPCPVPTLNLTCPEMICPNTSCSACSACPDIPPCPTCPPKRVIPPGYELTPNLGIHKFIRIERTYSSANASCGLDGGYLAIPDSMEELNLYLNLMMTNNENIIHIGFHDSVHEGEFITVLGEPMTAVQNRMWRAGEPSTGASADCVYLGIISRALFDGRCADPEPYICEISM